MKKIELSIEDLKVRDKIIKQISIIELLGQYGEVKGKLHFLSQSFGFKGTMSEFSNILSSIYQYEKKEGWEFLIRGVSVYFNLN